GEIIRGVAKESIGDSEAATGTRSHVLNLNVSVIQGRLAIAIEYSDSLHRAETIERFGASLRSEIEVLLGHTAVSRVGALSPSDFPLVDIDAKGLAAMEERLGHREIEAIYPLTGLQRGLLARVLYGESSDTYKTHIALSLYGELDRQLLAQAWQVIAKRHELLRSCFQWEGLEKPVQVVVRDVDIPWEEQRNDAGVAEGVFVKGSLELPLDIAPVGRVGLRQVADQHHELIFYSHHVLLDGWSMFVMIRDVLETYRAKTEGRAPRLRAPGSYEVYARRLAHADQDAAKKFWRADLVGFDDPTPLPAQRATARGEAKECRHSIRLDIELSRQLTAAAERERVTLASVLEGLWALVASRYSDCEDVLFGTVVSGRDSDIPGITEMAGLFIHTLPVRMYVDETLDVWTWLRAHQVRQAQRREYQYLPLAEIQTCADVAPGIDLFKSLVVFENYPIDVHLFDGAGLRVEFHSASSPTHYPMVVSAVPGETFEIHLDFESTQFDKQVVERIGKQLEYLVRQFVAEARPRVEFLQLSDDQERKQLLKWSQGSQEVGEHTSIHALFEAEVDRNPDAAAIVIPALESHQVRNVTTFAELDARANQLANSLIAGGVQTGEVIPLFLPRTVDAIAAIFAVLKSGAAFVVLDPELPMRRLEAMLEDIRPRFIVTEAKLVGRIPVKARPGLEVVQVCESQASCSLDRPRRKVRETCLAYLLFTSGTTGKPNGVLVKHHGVCNVIVSAAKQFEIGQGTSYANPLSLNFDGGLFNTFCALCNGGTMVFVPREGDFLGQGLVDMMAREGVTHTLMVPSMLATLPQVDLPKLTTVMVAGEICPAE
ncbi:MAG: condensation domain-containing protein, partial [Nannocystaceae bacterium]